MIPAFNLSGVIPPYIGGDPTVSANMAPYRTTLEDLVVRFSTSPERREILAGLIQYREGLRGLGFTNGFQWVDGSFVEDVERIRNRPPGDVDIVSFIYIPSQSAADQQAWVDKVTQNPWLITRAESKRLFKCDAFLVNLTTHPEFLVNQTKYWFGLFSHQRDTALWKGMLEISLAEDSAAALAALNGGGNAP